MTKKHTADLIFLILFNGVCSWVLGLLVTITLTASHGVHSTESKRYTHPPDQDWAEGVFPFSNTVEYIVPLSSRCPTFLSPGGYASWTLIIKNIVLLLSQVSCFPLPWPAERHHWSMDSVYFLSISNLYKLPGNLLKNVAGYNAKGIAHQCLKKAIPWFMRVSRPRERSERCFSICIKSGEFGADTLWEALRPGVEAEEKMCIFSHYFSDLLWINAFEPILFSGFKIHITWLEKVTLKALNPLPVGWSRVSQSSGGGCLCSVLTVMVLSPLDGIKLIWGADTTLTSPLGLCLPIAVILSLGLWHFINTVSWAAGSPSGLFFTGCI